MDEYLGVEVPDDANGVLQDTHWASGLIGYFSTYLLGTVMSVQIWEKIQRGRPDLEDRIERGDFTALREWLGDNVHAHGPEVHAAGDAATRDRLDASTRSRTSRI